MEGFGLTAIEALILGKPVFNSGVGGLGEIFSNNKSFICSDDEYVNKIKKLLSSDKYYNDLIKDNSKIFSKFCDKNAWINSLKSVYEADGEEKNV
jgi:glycosyltransferase involved in cell wall biosynthesis